MIASRGRRNRARECKASGVASIDDDPGTYAESQSLAGNGRASGVANRTEVTPTGNRSPAHPNCLIVELRVTNAGDVTEVTATGNTGVDAIRSSSYVWDSECKSDFACSARPEAIARDARAKRGAYRDSQ